MPGPLVPGFHPDPSVVRVGSDYWLATSSFEYRPAVPIHTSTDLLAWELVGHVVDRPGVLDDSVPSSSGAWAPTIRHHGGSFHAVFTDARGAGTLLFSTDHPTNGWGDPIPIPIDGIDPDIAWDADGTCLITYAALTFRPFRHSGLQQVRIDPRTGALLEEPRAIWSGTGRKFAEAPHLYDIDGTWYLLIAEGGTDHGHAISVARSESPDGPFEPCPSNPILSASGTDRAVQNTGHGDLVVGPDGRWRMVLLGTRVRGRGFSPIGRETFLTDVDWKDGWPEVAPPEPGGSMPTTADEWIGVRRRPDRAASIGGTSVALTGEGRTMDHAEPTFVGRRVVAFDSTVCATINDRTGVGGLSLRYDEHHHYDIEVDGQDVIARARLATIVDERRIPTPGGPITLVIEIRPPAGIPGMRADEVALAIESAGSRIEVAAFDGRYLTAEAATSFTGRVVGAYCVSGSLTFEDWSGV